MLLPHYLQPTLSLTKRSQSCSNQLIIPFPNFLVHARAKII